MPAAPRRRDIDGRPAITREEIMARTGAGRSTVGYWIAHRDETEFPEPVARIGRGDYFDEATVETWWPAFQDRKRAGVTRLDDSGDPDELVGTTEVARMLGYSSPSVVHDYLHKHPGYFPEPDQLHEPGSRGPGPRRLYWHRRTVWAWARGRGVRTGGGRPPGT